MIPSEPIQTKSSDDLADEIRELVDLEIGRPAPESAHAKPTDAETQEDDAWMDACRTEMESDPFDEIDESFAASAAATIRKQDDRESLKHDRDDSGNTADRADSGNRGAAIEKTGDDAMSKFGHAIGALAESEEDLDDHALNFAAEMDSPSAARDESVAPHIAAAERELERSKSSGPVDIFDRIAQAAESQFDETRIKPARRVSELVDDRRVGTKKWTPSKTMKQRMEKLEAARAAAAGGAAAAKPTAAAVETPVVEEPVLEAAPVAASAPMSSTATTVRPQADKKPEVAEQVPPAPMTEEQKVTISRRDRQADVEETTETESAGAEDAIAAEDELDADGLRVVPGVRGRRRDRARKSRLDEDFEKIFDDEGKPSINSLRRKLRSTAASEEAAEKEGSAAPVKAATTEEQFGATADQGEKKGLFSRLLNKKPAKKVIDVSDEDELVSAFEDDTVADLPDNFDLEDGVDEDWQTAVSNERKQKQIAMPIIGAGAFIALGGLGWFAYKFFLG